MVTSKKFEIIKNLRLATVIGVGAIGTLTTSFLVASGLRNAVASQATLSDLTAILLGCTALGLLLTALFCLLVFHAFSFFESTTLGQGIRLNEAMRMLHAKTNRESLDALKYYGISVFKAKKALGDSFEENVPCKLISTFLSPWFFRSDRIAAFGSDNHCCDFTQIQEIISANQTKWGKAEEHVEEQTGEPPIEVAALERKIADLLEKNKKANLNSTATNARNSQLETQVAEAETHMAILVELTNKVTNEVKPPQRITKDEIKAKYVSIGKLHGITKAPGKYVSIFRKNMPKEIINWSGAPNQGSEDEET
ncbi:hypothetical protein LJC36_01500 [Desulfovibrio sp. OttesenSCG-928-C14]|nr:hypothetical protein [Desulfovibrio sp. OttesenSCG-928-C14]